MMVDRLHITPSHPDPYGKGRGFPRTIDLIAMKALIYDSENLGANFDVVDIPRSI